MFSIQLSPDRNWMQEADCRNEDPSHFFPDQGVSPTVAREICDGCPVRQECLNHALTHGEWWGVWGGKTETERRRIRRQSYVSR